MSHVMNAWFSASAASIEGSVVTATCFGNGGLYISEQSVDFRQTGSKYKMGIEVRVRNDSDGDCTASSSDALVSGAIVAWELSDSASGAVVYSGTGATDVAGLFLDQNINVAAGEYTAIANLSLEGYARSDDLDVGNPAMISLGGP
jgi:hypothetical protein